MPQAPLKKRDLSGSMAAAAESVSAAPDEYDSSGLDDFKPSLFVGTGSTVLNCACTGNAFNGFGAGTMVNIVGASDTGKTFICLSACAEAANNPAFDNYDIIYDDVEAALAFDIRGMFGAKAARRLQPPAKTQEGYPIYSNTVEELNGNLVNRVRAGKPFIYIVDSIDALSDYSEIERAVEYGKKVEEHQNEQTAYDAENPDAGMEGVKTAGSFKVNKPKILSEMLRTICLELRRTGSILITISQIRDNINPLTARYEPHVRSGGRALKFYATHEIWLYHTKKITANAKGADGTAKTGGKKPLVIGSEVRASVKKSKIAGFKREANYNVYTSYGIDDITSCVDYLLLYGYGEQSANTIDLTDVIGQKGTMAVIVKAVDNDPELYQTLRAAVGTAWKAVEDSVAVKRNRRYE